jgi:hypothetical protein
MRAPSAIKSSPKVVPAASPAPPPPVQCLSSPAVGLFRAITPVLSLNAWATASPVPLPPSSPLDVPPAGAGRCVLCDKVTTTTIDLSGGPASCCWDCTKKAVRPAQAPCAGSVRRVLGDVRRRQGQARQDAAAKEWSRDVACAKLAVALIVLGMLVVMGIVIADG